MDVTSKAGPLAQPRHQQDLYDEPTNEMEFGALLGQLQFSAGAAQGLENIIVPSNELTVGMERYESSDSGVDSDLSSEGLIAVQKDDGPTASDDDVEEADASAAEAGGGVW